MTIDIKDFYLSTKLKQYEYLCLKLDDLPEDVIKHYKLQEKVNRNGYVYGEIQGGMHGLPQAGLLA